MPPLEQVTVSLNTNCCLYYMMIIMSSEMVFLKVPREVAKKIEQLAEKDGITDRGKWQIKARMILKQAAEAGE